jgi:hypothetical protein
LEEKSMAKYDVIYNCGHAGRVDLIGKVKERERKIKWMESSGICPECWEAEKKRQHEAEAQKAAAEADELGLPDLEGTEKQIAWALTLRKEWISKIEKNIAMAEKKIENGVVDAEKGKKVLAGIREEMENRLIAETSARYWIDNRDQDINRFLDHATQKALAPTPTPVPEEIKKQALEEMVIRPAVQVSNLVAEISHDNARITVKFPERSDKFREIVKGLGYEWVVNSWLKKISTTNGPAQERATELGVNLLAAGFAVRVHTDELHKKILASEYEAEATRWIMKNTNKETGAVCFIIKWKREEDFFRVAKKLPGARWERGEGMKVPKEAFRELLDFAGIYDFKLSPGARELVEEAKAMFEAAMVADVKLEKKKQVTVGTEIPKLEIPAEVEIDETLRD